MGLVHSMLRVRIGFVLPQSSCVPKLSLFVAKPLFRDVCLIPRQSWSRYDLIVAMGLWPMFLSLSWFSMGFGRRWCCHSSHEPDFCVLEISVVLGRLPCK